MKRALLALTLAAGCSGAPLASDFERAQTLEAEMRAGDALAAYAAIRASCARPDTRLRNDCGLAATREAQILERLGRDAEAAAAWEALPDRTGDSRQKSRAITRAAEVSLEKLHDPGRAVRLAWRCVESWPDEVAADDALALALRVDRPRDPGATLLRVDALARSLGDRDVVDNLIAAGAEIARGLGDGKGAVARYDELARRFPRSGLLDDANYQAALILRDARDFPGALLRLKRILDTKRRALIVGSYNAMLLDDAQLLTGLVLLDDLHDPASAAAAFTRLADEYKDSLLRDDALYELTRARLAAHTPPTDEDRAAACAALARLLKEYPEGNRARAARAKQEELRCGAG
ncbi:MAG: hypothetical protein EXR72_09335 [Myxococcales bacterium]|nr:hypothetical protein [Myxococcales bacterium]